MAGSGSRRAGWVAPAFLWKVHLGGAGFFLLALVLEVAGGERSLGAILGRLGFVLLFLGLAWPSYQQRRR